MECAQTDLFLVPTMEHATQICQLGKKTWFFEVLQATERYCPLDLFMDISNLSFNRNGNLFKGNCSAVGIKGILGIETSSLLHHSDRIFVSKKCGIIYLPTGLVPLQNPGRSRFLSNIIGAPTHSGVVIQIDLMGSKR